MTSAKPGWTDELVETITKSWNAGNSATEIGAAIGVSRNAVLGKLSRLGLLGTLHLKAGQAPRPKPTSAQPRRKPRPAAKPVDKTANRKVSVLAIEDFIVEPLTLPDQRGMKLHELTNTTCRWPLGPTLAPAELYCGATQADLSGDRPYCPFHTRKARQ